MLTTVSIFQNNDELAIPLSSDGVKERKLCQFINDYEPEFILKAIGNDVWDLCNAGITAEEQRWLDLRDGVSYSLNGITTQFDGLLPLIAAYVYCFYMDHEASTTTLTGEKSEQAANAANILNRKMLRIWNKMSRNMEGLWDFLYSRVDGDGAKVYPEFDTCAIDINNFRPRNALGI